jgi:hypothetical protein
MKTHFLPSLRAQFAYYKLLGEKTFDQVKDENLFHQINEESNSMATIVKHLHGNMLSRWTDFLTTDGEKQWRKREEEFDNDINSRNQMLEIWMEGWSCLFSALDSLKEEDLNKEIFIRNQGHSVAEAIYRQLAHYSYHVGQIVFLGKVFSGDKWNSLSIPKGKTREYNAEKFAQPKEKKHFTDEFLNDDEK